MMQIANRQKKDEAAPLAPLRCKAEHWANVIQLKAHVLTSIDLSGYAAASAL